MSCHNESFELGRDSVWVLFVHIQWCIEEKSICGGICLLVVGGGGVREEIQKFLFW